VEYVPLLHRVEVEMVLRQAQGGHGELVEPFPLPFIPPCGRHPLPPREGRLLWVIFYVTDRT